MGRLRGASSTAEEIAEILQQAKEVRWAALPRHAGSGRAPTARRLHVTYNPVPPPPTPFVPTPAVSGILTVNLHTACIQRNS